MTEQERLLYTVEEAANRLAMSRSHVYEEIAAGRLKSVRAGRSRRIPVDALAEYVQGLQE